MKRWASAIPVLAFVIFALSACDSGSREPTRGYKRAVNLERTLAFRPRRFPDGDASAHPCIRGDYSHVYEAQSALFEDDVYLCCVPVEEILSDSFPCAASPIPNIFGNTDDAKIRFCSLLHPTETEPTYIPVCIPAPLEAPGLDEPG